MKKVIAFFPVKASTTKITSQWRWYYPLQLTLWATLITASIAGCRSLGLLQALELSTFDQALRARSWLFPLATQERRVTIVAIHESDMARFGQLPVSDQVVAEILEKIRSQNPVAIGMHLYRNLPVKPGTAALHQILRETPNLVGIQKEVGPTRPDIAGNPVLASLGRLSANDLLIDKDGRVRRGLLFLNFSADDYRVGFAMQLAGMYLQAKGIEPDPQSTYLKLGGVAFNPLNPNSGGYSRVDAGGYQILLSPQGVAGQISVVSATEVLKGRIDPNLLQNKVVLLGAVSSEGDFFLTSLSNGQGRNGGLVSAVEIHAALTHQIISAVLDRHPLLTTWIKPLEYAWIGLWTLSGLLLLWYLPKRRKLVVFLALQTSLWLISGMSLIVFGLWLPLAPTTLSLVAGLVIALFTQSQIALRRSQTDAVTQIFNRACLDEYLNEQWRQMQKLGKPLAVILADVDCFKLYNDTYGHVAGDLCLRKVAAAIQHNVCRGGDLVARYGGEEFAIVLPDTDLTSAMQVAEMLRQAIEQLQLEHRTSRVAPWVTASFGVSALVPQNGHLVQQLVSEADHHLYAAKRSGRNRVSAGDRKSDSGFSLAEINFDRLLQELPQAIGNGEIVLYYQPIVCLNSSRIRGFEALVRWQHPHLGLLPPERFISLAEKSGLMVPLGNYVLAAACHQLRVWQDLAGYSLTMSVNVSGLQLCCCNFLELVLQHLQCNQLEPRCLILEITETSELDISLIGVLAALKNLGVKIHIDDFGTGYSSLSHIDQFPIDAIKIDRSFVARSNLESTKTIVAGLISISTALGLNVVAEGVETEDQRIVFRDLGCAEAQGYLFEKPLAAATISDLLVSKTHFWI